MKNKIKKGDLFLFHTNNLIRIMKVVYIYKSNTSFRCKYIMILDNSLLPKTWTFTKKDIESFFTKITKKELNIIRLLYEK